MRSVRWLDLLQSAVHELTEQRKSLQIKATKGKNATVALFKMLITSLMFL